MPTVVAVRRSGGAATVEFDDGASLRCTRDFLQRMRVSSGQEIAPVFVARLRETAEADLALHEASRLARRGRYSRRDIASRLHQAGVSSEAAREALDTLALQGELDDAATALALAKRGLRLALARDPQVTRQQFFSSQTQRLALRGFNSGTAATACRDAWTAFEAEPAQSSLAPNGSRA